MASTRFPPMPPSDLTPAQRPAYEACDTMGSRMGPFTYKNSQGALLGPFALFIHTPTLLPSAFELTRQISSLPALSPRARELAILATGAAYNCAYELYAHTRVALSLPSDPLTHAQIEAAVEGNMPLDLSKEEIPVWRFAHRVASSKGPVRTEEVLFGDDKGIGYNEAEKVLGRERLLAVVHVVGIYGYLCMMLNVGDVGLPEGQGVVPEEGWKAGGEGAGGGKEAAG